MTDVRIKALSEAERIRLDRLENAFYAALWRGSAYTDPRIEERSLRQLSNGMAWSVLRGDITAKTLLDLISVLSDAAWAGPIAQAKSADWIARIKAGEK